MGTWGYRMYENDTFCEVVDFFRDRISAGMSIKDVISEIEHEYGSDVDACLSSLAIAESLWRLGKLSQSDLEKVHSIIDEGTDCAYWMQLGADEEFIRNRCLELEGFVSRLSRAPTAREKWSIPLSVNSLRKGVCFWYRHRGNIYSATVVEKQENALNYYLIAISEKMDFVPQTISHVLASPVYTVAWFGDVDLLSPRRIHIVGEVSVFTNYKNKFGLKIEANRSVCITNCGQTSTWAHSFRQISFNNLKIKDFVS